MTKKVTEKSDVKAPRKSTRKPRAPIKAKGEDQNRTKVAKARFLESLKVNLGIVTTACNEAKIDRGTYYLWMDKDPEFKKQVEDVQELVLDFVEDAMYERIKAGSEALIKFYMESKGKKRGFAKNQDLEINANGNANGISINISFGDND